MGTRAYHLAMDSPESPANYATDTVAMNVAEFIIPNTGYRDFTVPTDTVVEMKSDTGEAYLDDAFDQTRDEITPAITTLRETLCNADTSSECSNLNWETVLNADDVVQAAYTIGQLRGHATFLYGMHYSHGLHTRADLADHLNMYGPESNSSRNTTDDCEEFVVIVPFDLTY